MLTKMESWQCHLPEPVDIHPYLLASYEQHWLSKHTELQNGAGFAIFAASSLHAIDKTKQV